MNLIIGLGNCGTQIVKEVEKNDLFDNFKLYSIDSVTHNPTSRINTIDIISDTKTGSGKNRCRGADMFELHDKDGKFKKLYADAGIAKSPVIVISSSAGGTGSGMCPLLCKRLIDSGIEIIPIIICPNAEDRSSEDHINNSDLFIELNEVGVERYGVFRNMKDNHNYAPVNKEVVEYLEILFRFKYDDTDLASIDESDMDAIIAAPGRILAVSATEPNGSIPRLQKEITRKVLNGFQPAWKKDSFDGRTVNTGYSLSSLYAEEDFTEVFSDINKNISNLYSEFRNIAPTEDGPATATIIIAGLPRPDMRIINTSFESENDLAKGLNRGMRPGFAGRKTLKPRSFITSDEDPQGVEVVSEVEGIQFD